MVSLVNQVRYARLKPLRLDLRAVSYRRHRVNEATQSTNAKQTACKLDNGDQNLACRSSCIISAFSRMVVQISRPPSANKNLAVVAYFSHTSRVMKGGSMTCGAALMAGSTRAPKKEAWGTDHHVERLQIAREKMRMSTKRGIQARQHGGSMGHTHAGGRGRGRAGC